MGRSSKKNKNLVSLPKRSRKRFRPKNLLGEFNKHSKSPKIKENFSFPMNRNRTKRTVVSPTMIELEREWEEEIDSNKSNTSNVVDYENLETAFLYSNNADELLKFELDLELEDPLNFPGESVSQTMDTKDPKEIDILNTCLKFNAKIDEITFDNPSPTNSVSTVPICIPQLANFDEYMDYENIQLFEPIDIFDGLLTYKFKDEDSQTDSLSISESNWHPLAVSTINSFNDVDENKIEENPTNCPGKCIYSIYPHIETIIENKLNIAQKTHWQCNTMYWVHECDKTHWLHGHVICRHRSIRSAELVVEFSVANIEDNIQTSAAILFSKVEFCKNDQIFNNLCSIGYLRHSTLMSKLPSNLLNDCPTSNQFSDFLESLDGIYRECYSLVTKLNEIVIKNDALLLGDKSQTFIKRIIFIEAIETDLEIIIKINTINTIGRSNVFLTPSIEFEKSIEEIPLGIDFVNTFLSDPITYLKT